MSEVNASPRIGVMKQSHLKYCERVLSVRMVLDRGRIFIVAVGDQNAFHEVMAVPPFRVPRGLKPAAR